MQHVENDMDDLFKRAAENYPLQQGDGDWESIANRIGATPDATGITVPPQKKGTKNYRALYLLLSVLAFCWLKLHDPVSGIYPLSSESRLTPIKGNGGDQPVIKKDNPGIFKGKKNFNTLSGNNKNGHFKKRVIMAERGTSIKVTTGGKNPLPFAGPEEALAIENNNHNNNYFPSAPEIEPGTGKDSSLHSTNYTAVLTESKKVEGNGKDHLNEAGKVVPSKNQQKGNKISFSKKNGIYLGIVAGPDLTKVQSMAYGNTGFDVGLIAGYQVNSKLSLETGITRNKKYYNSKGKDFSMDKIRASMASGMVINNLESQSSLLEIPIKVNYNIIRQRNSVLFVSGGLSSYIMTKEKNMYHVSLNGNQEKISGVYDRNNYRLPAVASFSIGYQQVVSNSVEIRIEPFFKIPLQGVGIGSLPLTSTGLQIGIISRLK